MDKRERECDYNAFADSLLVTPEKGLLLLSMSSVSYSITPNPRPKVRAKVVRQLSAFSLSEGPGGVHLGPGSPPSARARQETVLRTSVLPTSDTAGLASSCFGLASSCRVLPAVRPMASGVNVRDSCSARNVPVTPEELLSPGDLEQHPEVEAKVEVVDWMVL